MIVNEGGKKLPKLTTPGTSADLLTGKELIDQYGNVVEGGMPFWEVPAPYILNDYAVSEGKLTAAVTLTPGYNKFRGSKSLTYQLSTKDDPNFVPQNIVEGKTIFGVAGTAMNTKRISGSLPIEIESETIITIPIGLIDECYFSFFLAKMSESAPSVIGLAYAYEYGGQLFINMDSSVSMSNIILKSSSDTTTEISVTGLYGKYSKITSYQGIAVIKDSI